MEETEDHTSAENTLIRAVQAGKGSKEEHLYQTGKPETSMSR